MNAPRQGAELMARIGRSDSIAARTTVYYVVLAAHPELEGKPVAEVAAEAGTGGCCSKRKV